MEVVVRWQSNGSNRLRYLVTAHWAELSCLNTAGRTAERAGTAMPSTMAVAEVVHAGHSNSAPYIVGRLVT
jgi:hypothetical protein